MTKHRSWPIIVPLLAGCATIGAIAGAAPSYASTLPRGSFTASLTPYASTVSGEVTLTHQSTGWIATAQLYGLTKGDHYAYEAFLAGNYVDGQAQSFQSFALCSFVATGATGSCGAANIDLGVGVLSPQSSAAVYSPEAHTAVANGQFSYQAQLSPASQPGTGGTADVVPNSDATWSGQVSVSGLTPGSTYTWALDVAEAYQNGQPVSFHRIVLCEFTGATSGRSGCTAEEKIVEGRADLPSGSYTDVASTVTSVVTGKLY